MNQMTPDDKTQQSKAEDLSSILLPYDDEQAIAYKQRITEAQQQAKSAPSARGGKSYSKYKTAMLSAAMVVAECWEKFGIDDKYMHRKTSLKASDEGREIERAALRMLSAMKEAVDGSMPSPPVQSTYVMQLADSVADKLMDKDTREQLAGQDIELPKGTSDKKLKEAVEILKSRQDRLAAPPPLSDEDAELAVKQLTTVKKGLSELKEEIKVIKTDPSMKKVAKQLNILLETAMNQANQFVETRVAGK